MKATTHGPTYWNSMVERTLNDRRPYTQEHVFLGDHYEHASPLVAPQSLFERHGLIYGPPGTGKTVLAAQLATQLIACGHNVVVIDCKGSLALLNNILSEAALAVDEESGEPQHQVRVFNPFGLFPSHVYNPFRQSVWLNEPPHNRTETLLDAFGIRGEEGGDTAFFTAMAFLISTKFMGWFPDVGSSDELLSLINDRHLYAAKGGNPTDWNHSRHIAASLRQLAACAPLNALAPADESIELTDIFCGEKPALFYFFLSAIEDQRTSDMIGRLVLQQLKKAAFRSRLHSKGRKTFVFCDEAQELFGPMFGHVLEQMREFGVSVLMFHQSRAQLITQAIDFRERFENAVGVQVCLGARTPDEIKYLQDTDREAIEYRLGWNQPQFEIQSNALLHPQHSYQPKAFEPQLVSVQESKCPQLDRGLILQVSADPQAGFIRGFLNEKLWAFDGSWVPFRWFHHLTRGEHREFSKQCPHPLPGQQLRVTPGQGAGPTAPEPKTGLEGISTRVETQALMEAIDLLSAEQQTRTIQNHSSNSKR